MKYMYGDLPDFQIAEVKKSIRSSIFFLLLCVDPQTADNYEDVNVNQAFDNLLYKLDGYNDLVEYQKEVVNVMSLLKEAQGLYNDDNFDFQIYRKLVLDAGSEVLKIKEVDSDDVL